MLYKWQEIQLKSIMHKYFISKLNISQCILGNKKKLNCDENKIVKILNFLHAKYF